jgi:hypothetical protein
MACSGRARAPSPAGGSRTPARHRRAGAAPLGRRAKPAFAPSARRFPSGRSPLANRHSPNSANATVAREVGHIGFRRGPVLVDCRGGRCLARPATRNPVPADHAWPSRPHFVRRGAGRNSRHLARRLIGAGRTVGRAARAPGGGMDYSGSRPQPAEVTRCWYRAAYRGTVSMMSVWSSSHSGQAPSATKVVSPVATSTTKTLPLGSFSRLM